MKKKIIIVDDEEDILMLVEKILEHGDFEIYTAHDAVSMHTRLKEIQPDLIILDVMMPGLDGFEICTQLKSNPRTKAIPVVMLTVMDRPTDIQRGLKLGAAAYLTKPFDPADLGREIQALLHPGTANSSEQMED